MKASLMGVGGLVLGLLAFTLLWTLYLPLTLDDAFISYRYAENFASGNGLVFNLGEHVEGYTNFLWVILLSVGHWLGIYVPFWSKALGYVSALASLVLVYRIANQTRNRSDELPSGIAVLLMATSPLFVAGSGDGLETALLTFLLLAGTLFYIRETTTEVLFPFSSILFLAAALTRPDAALFFGVVILHRVFVLKEKPFERRFVRALLLFLVPFIAHLLWRYGYYGYFLPNTFYAKGFGSNHHLRRGAKVFISFVFNVGPWFLLLMSVPLLFKSPQRRWYVLFFGFVVVRLAFAIGAGGATMSRQRFYAPAVPFIYLLAIEGILLLLQKYFYERKKALQVAVICTLGVAFSSINAWKSVKTYKRLGEPYVAGLQRAHVALGRWLKSSAPKGSTLAAGDVGAIPYYSGFPTIDTLGLTDDHIGHLQGEFFLKIDAEYILERKPTYVVLISQRPDMFESMNFIDDALFPLLRPRNYRRILLLEFGPRYFLWVYQRLITKG